MKISAYFPKGYEKADVFLEQQLFRAKKSNNKPLSQAIQQIIKFIDPEEIRTKRGWALFVDEEEFAAVPYDGPQQIFEIGQNIILGPFSYIFNSDSSIMLAVDTTNWSIAILKNNQIQLLWDKNFYLNGKYKQGNKYVEEQKRNLSVALEARMAEILGIKPKERVIEKIQRFIEKREVIFKKIRVKKIWRED
jgi:hypothetical protein